MAKSKSKPGKCVKKKIVIKRKSGKVIASFIGRTGAGCGPRTSKPKFPTAAKKIHKVAHKQCGKRFGFFNKKYGSCIRDAFKSSYR